MQFSIDPYSGHADSYFDIRFEVSFDTMKDASIHFVNNDTKQKLEILSSMNGTIINGTELRIKNSNRAVGYINLFNNDKMNRKLSDFSVVNISCHSESDVSESSECSFYNESKSVDSCILPVDVILTQKCIELDKDESLKLSILCSAESKHEFCLKSKTNKYSFEVVCKNGRTDIEIPSEVIGHHLRETDEVKVLYVKFEGVNYSKQMVRKYIDIPKATFAIKGVKTLRSQDRTGPDGKDLPDNFVLSDRYFVHTWNKFSSFGKSYDLAKNIIRSRFFHEIRDLSSQNNNVFVSKARAISRKENFTKNSNSIEASDSTEFLRHFSKSNAPQPAINKEKAKKSGCSGCSRHKK